MLTINDVITNLLPYGTSMEEDDEKNWETAPAWPPDLFAIAATLANKSSCYTNQRYDCTKKSIFGNAYRNKVSSEAKIWQKNITPGRYTQSLWKIILKNKNSSLSNSSYEWQDAVMKLISIADEASIGMGIDVLNEDHTKLCDIAHLIYFRGIAGKIKNKFSKNNSPLRSLCILVPEEAACVLPKTLTSQVGCTIRSLSHHLALLPSIYEVKTEWNVLGDFFFERQDELNLLLIPYPFIIKNSDFKIVSGIDDHIETSGHFKINQSWLKTENIVQKIVGMICELVNKSKSQKTPIHGVVLPELALSKKIALDVSKKLAKESDIQFFITGISGNLRNSALSTLFHKENFHTYIQSKHHRWRLDKGQIDRYKLNKEFQDKAFWWENIQISDRVVNIFSIRPGISFVSLVCEDLARLEPLQNVIRSVGPNLVVALLQDGPQSEYRWSAKYATVLSEDPGSSVLTLTSMGMINRALDVGDFRAPRTIAIWKDPHSKSKELDLPVGSHGLVLKLNKEDMEHSTLDGRSDYEGSGKLILNDVSAVALENPHKWLAE